MKTLYLCLFTLWTLKASAGMCPCESGGKDGRKTRMEVGINVFRFSEKLFGFHSPYPVYETAGPAGLMFKYHFDRFSLRGGADLIRHSYHTEQRSNMPFYENNKGKSVSGEFRAGVEKTMSSGKLRLYAGIDLVYTTASYEGRVEGYGDLSGPYVWDYRFYAGSAGISPFAGVNYRPFPKWSLSLEASCILFGYRTKNSYGPYTSETGTGLMFNPIRILSVNYHFDAR